MYFQFAFGVLFFVAGILVRFGFANPALTAGTWVKISPAKLSPCTDLQFDPTNRSTLWAVYGDSGVYKSEDGGATWIKRGNLPSLGRVRIDPKNPNHLYYIGSVSSVATQSFYVTTDGGASWAIPAAFKAGASKWTYDMYNMAVDPSDFNHVIITTHGNWPGFGDDAGVLETKDGGVSFIAHNPPTGINHGQGIAFLSNPAKGIGNGNIWLVGCGYAAGLFRTADGGSTWSKISSTIQDNHGGFDLHYSITTGNAYFGAMAGIYRSTDNGLNWTLQTTGVPYAWYSSVISDGYRLYSGQSFVGVTYNKAYLTSLEGGTTEGITWTDYSSQTLPEGPWRMEYDEVNHIIYSATWSGGAWALKTNNPETSMVNRGDAEGIQKDLSVNSICLVKNKLVVKHMDAKGKTQLYNFNSSQIK